MHILKLKSFSVLSGTSRMCESKGEYVNVNKLKLAWGNELCTSTQTQELHSV